MNKLQHRFLAITTLIIVLSIVVGFIISNILYGAFVKDQFDERQIGVLEQFTTQIEDENLSFEEATVFLQSMSEIDYQMVLLHEDGSQHTFGTPFDDYILTPEMSSLLDDQTIYHGISNFQTTFLMMSHFSNTLANTVGMPVDIENEAYALFLRSTNESTFSGIHLILLGYMVAVIVISVLGILLFSRKLIHSITELTSATQEIAKNNFDYPLTIHGKDEIGQLADSFRMMQEKLSNTDETRRKFINNVSHDFQTPLLNILGYTELLEAETPSPEGKKYNQIIQTEAKRLSNLTKKLLVLTSLDQGTYPLQKQSVRLDEQLQSVVHSMMWWIQEKELEISFDLKPIEINGDKSLLFNAWENLMSNAIKYNKRYGSIHIQCYEDIKVATVIIQDTGIGIDQSERDAIFDRFYRVDEARKRDGTGLGLAIVREVLSYHQATVQIESELGEGTTFIIQFSKL